jgi:hypothetical protein
MMAVAGSTPDIGFEAAAVMGLLASLTSAKKNRFTAGVTASGRLRGATNLPAR